MKYLLFLDFDGVTHPRIGSAAFLPSCMYALRLALDDINIEIVVSSTWRKTNHLYELEAFLRPLGKPFIGITPVVNEPNAPKYVRYREITQFLSDSKLQSCDWVAVDDAPGLFPDNAPIFFTNPLTGFTANDVPKLRKMIIGQ